MIDLLSKEQKDFLDTFSKEELQLLEHFLTTVKLERSQQSKRKQMCECDHVFVKLKPVYFEPDDWDRSGYRESGVGCIKCGYSDLLLSIYEHHYGQTGFEHPDLSILDYARRNNPHQGVTLNCTISHQELEQARQIYQQVKTNYSNLDDQEMLSIVCLKLKSFSEKPVTRRRR